MDEIRKQLEKWASEGKTNSWMANSLGVGDSTVARWLKKWNIKKKTRQVKIKEVKEEVQEDTRLHRLRARESALSKKYKVAIDQNEGLEKMLEATLGMKTGVKTTKIKKRKNTGKSESTIVVVASDWHIEEEVRPESLAGDTSNTYNLEISKKCSEHFFRTALMLTEIESQHTNINTMVVALLGDFVTGNLIDEMLEITLLEPAEAIVRATEYLQSGLQFLLDNSDLDLIVQCHTGNHGRFTKKTHVSTEYGNSYETLMYVFLANYFKDEPRITFNIPKSYHSLLQIYDWTIRFHHGHAIRGGQGIGGIASPIMRKIAKWDTSQRVDHDVFGHFHQLIDGNKFLVNGSMIGYNPYAVQIGASVEAPAQLFFGIHSERGKFVTRPILFPKRS